MRLLVVALTMSLLTGAAWSGGIAPQADQPDVVYIGDGWPANLTNGCVDRGECKLPEFPKVVRPSYPSAMPGSRGFGSGTDCTGAVQGVGSIRQMYDIVTRCISGG
jgi:hypothetical protein